MLVVMVAVLCAAAQGPGRVTAVTNRLVPWNSSANASLMRKYKASRTMGTLFEGHHEGDILCDTFIGTF